LRRSSLNIGYSVELLITYGVTFKRRFNKNLFEGLLIYWRKKKWGLITANGWLVKPLLRRFRRKLGRKKELN